MDVCRIFRYWILCAHGVNSMKFITELWTNAEGQAAIMVEDEKGLVLFCRILSINEGVNLVNAGMKLNHDSEAEFYETNT